MSNAWLNAAWEADVPNPTAKLVLVLLADHANQEGTCWPGQARIAQRTGLCHRTVQRRIKTLEAENLISICRQSGPGHTNIYHLLLGVTPVTIKSYADYLNGPHWKTARAAALKRARHACQLCAGKTGLQVHHRSYDRLGAERADDLSVLCDRCHQKFHDVLPTIEPGAPGVCQSAG